MYSFVFFIWAIKIVSYNAARYKRLVQRSMILKSLVIISIIYKA